MDVERTRRKIGQNLRTEREDLDISQSQLAEQMVAIGFRKWVRQTVSDVERGRRAVLGEELFGLALIFGSSAANLLRINTKAPLDYGGLKPLPAAVVSAWLDGQMRITLGWDAEVKRHTQVTFSPERHGGLQTLNALESIGLIPLKETIRDEHGNVIEERYPPETAALRKERGIKEPGKVEE